MPAHGHASPKIFRPHFRVKLLGLKIGPKEKSVCDASWRFHSQHLYKSSFPSTILLLMLTYCWIQWRMFKNHHSFNISGSKRWLGKVVRTKQATCTTKNGKVGIRTQQDTYFLFFSSNCQMMIFFYISAGLTCITVFSVLCFYSMHCSALHQSPLVGSASLRTNSSVN